MSVSPWSVLSPSSLPSIPLSGECWCVLAHDASTYHYSLEIWIEGRRYALEPQWNNYHRWASTQKRHRTSRPSGHPGLPAIPHTLQACSCLSIWDLNTPCAGNVGFLRFPMTDSDVQVLARLAWPTDLQHPLSAPGASSPLPCFMLLSVLNITDLLFGLSPFTRLGVPGGWGFSSISFPATFSVPRIS